MGRRKSDAPRPAHAPRPGPFDPKRSWSPPQRPSLRCRSAGACVRSLARMQQQRWGEYAVPAHTEKQNGRARSPGTRCLPAWPRCAARCSEVHSCWLVASSKSAPFSSSCAHSSAKPWRAAMCRGVCLYCGERCAPAVTRETRVVARVLGGGGGGNSPDSAAPGWHHIPAGGTQRHLAPARTPGGVGSADTASPGAHRTARR